MEPSAQSALESWSIPVPLTSHLVLAGFLYLRGWLRLRSASVNAIAFWRAASFFVGLFLLWVALGSPLAAFDEDLLTVHMVQHLLLMTVGPPLILLGAPLMPILHGFPRKFVQWVLAPLFRWPPMRWAGGVLSRPAVCWLAGAAALVGWHVPALFTFALRSEAWHVVEHTCFLGSGLLFWWPVIQPWPSAPTWPRWSILLYLFLATLPCDILSAFLVFCDRVVFAVYLSAPKNFSISALADQQCAGALMWTCVTIVYLIAATIVATRLLSPRNSRGNEWTQSDLPAAFAPSGGRQVARLADDTHKILDKPEAAFSCDGAR
jgi:putative membrane protein